MWGLIVVVTLLLGAIAYLVRAASTRERIMLIIAIATGYAAAGVYAFGGQTFFTPTLTRHVWLFVFLYFFFGLLSSIVLLRLIRKNAEMTPRLIALLASGFIVYAVSSVGYILDYDSADATNDEVAERFHSIEFKLQYLRGLEEDDAHKREILDGIATLASMTKAQALETVQRTNALSILIPIWSFIVGIFGHLVFFSPWKPGR